jgi:hypothetical protein
MYLKARINLLGSVTLDFLDLRYNGFVLEAKIDLRTSSTTSAATSLIIAFICLSGSEASKSCTNNLPPGTIGIGIETEFLLVARDKNLNRGNIRDFSRALASGYNQSINGNTNKHPGMHNAIDESYLGERFSEWSLDSDSTIETPKKGQAPCEHASHRFLNPFTNTNNNV